MRTWQGAALAAAALTMALRSDALAQDDPFGETPPAGPTAAQPPVRTLKPLPRLRLRGYAEPKGGAAVAYLEIDAERRLVRGGEVLAVQTGGFDLTLEVATIADGAVTLTVRDDGRKVVVR